MSVAPAGYHTVTPYLVVKGAPAAIDWYRQALGAEEVLRLPMPDGSLAHAEIKVGDSHLMLGEENPEWGATGPAALGGTSVGFVVYVRDVDAAYAKAVAAGARAERPVQDQFWGDRTGTVVDPFGHKWTLATHLKDMTPAEMQAAMDDWLKSMPAA